MKTLLPLSSGLCALFLAGCVGAEPVYYEQPVPVTAAQTPPPPPPLEPPPSFATVVAQPAVTIEPLDQLVAPIALYPDPLLALLLPASTVSSDIVLAARFFAAGGDPQQVDAQSWDESVKGLAHYPEVVKWMDENLAWTQQLGAAYLDSPDKVMAAVQRVRAQARAKGLLTDNPQQQVVLDGDTVAIVPAQPDVIYVPRYDPEVIFVDRPVIYATDPWLTFGVGFGIGWWLNYDFDWHHRVIWVDRHSRDHWRDHRRDWRQPHFPGGGGAAHDPSWQPWRPAPGRPRPPHRDFDRDRHPVPRPTPLPGTPHRDRDRRNQPPRAPDGPPRRTSPGDDHRSHPDRPTAPPRVQPPRADRVAPVNRPVQNPSQPHEPGNRRHERRDEPATPTPSQPRSEQRRDNPAPVTASPVPAPQERPRLPSRPERRVDRVPPAGEQARPAQPAMDRAPAQPPPETRRAAPEAPRQERTERAQPRQDRQDRGEPAPRATRDRPAENADRSREERDRHEPDK